MRYWDYYLALESDLLACRRYVAFEAANMGVYSIEFMRLLLVACSEVEVPCKQLCKRIDPAGKPENITYFRSTLEPVLSFSSFQVNETQTQRIFPPFLDWKERDSPTWWDAHNDVKHNRARHYERATLENAINALAGLFVLNLYQYHEAVAAADLMPESTLFVPVAETGNNWKIRTHETYLLPHRDKLPPD
jgi:hypothetical protein